MMSPQRRATAAALRDAARQGSAARLEALLESAPDVPIDALGTAGAAALHIAASQVCS